MADHKDIEKKSFEDALGELEEIVQQLESGNAPLEESITLYERGAALKAHCEARLKSAREKVEKIILDENGEAKAEPARFD
ncbi:MAG: exodeoxyribonuclease VII small subunit [Aquisalinus sp.]|nr:exodeoxyribonuclease VII small subunit [Aquisalinus sp.]